MGAELDLDDVCAESPSARKQLWDLRAERDHFEELHAQAKYDNASLRAEVKERKKGQQIQARALLRLNAEVERLKQDAERYRWLRENVVHCELVGWKTTGSLNAMDETVDAALAAGRE